MPSPTSAKTNTARQMGALVATHATPWGLAVFVFMSGYANRFACDDAIINARVVANVLAGDGPVLNAGERIEAVTSPLWLLVLSIAAWLGVSVEVAAVWLGLLASSVAVGWTAHTAARLWPGEGPVLPLGGVVFVCLPASWQFFTSGLENGLIYLWLAASFHLLVDLARVDGASRLRTTLTGAVVGLGLLVRPDLGFTVAGLLASGLLVTRSRGDGARAAAALILGALALPLTVQLLRMGYYGAVVPNSAIAKLPDGHRIEQGLTYLRDFYGRYWLWVPLGIVAWIGLRALRIGDPKRRPLILGALAAAALARHAYIVWIGGDFMHGRWWLPPLFLVLMPVMAFRLPAASGRRRLELAGLAAIAVWSVIVASSVRPSADRDDHISDERRTWVEWSGREHPILASDYSALGWYDVGAEYRALAASPGPRRLVLSGRFWGEPATYDAADWYPPSVRLVGDACPLGVLSVVAGRDVFIVDRWGLGDPYAARIERLLEGQIGHERMLENPWLLARHASVDTPLDERGRSARRALRCGLLRELHLATTAPMTPARFARNLWHAWDLTWLRIPRDVGTAERLFCGD